MSLATDIEVLSGDVPSGAQETPRRASWLGRNIFALGDQGVISSTNFVTGVLTARALREHTSEFGTFSVVYNVLLLLNILQSTLITQAHNVLGATREGADYKRYTSSVAFAQVLMAAAEMLLVLPVLAVAWIWHWDALPMILALIPSIAAWQLQEFARRVMYTEGRYYSAFVNDVISYGGQAAVLAAFYIAHTHWGYPFTGALALWVLAGTSAAAALLACWQLRHSLARAFDIHDLWESWHFGKWLLGGEMMQWCASLPMQVWWAALLVGTVASADLRAAQILFGPTRVVTFFLGTVLPIKFAQTLHRQGRAALHAKVRAVYMFLLPVAGVYCMLLALFPRPLLRVVYGREYATDDAVKILILYSVAAFLSYIQMVIAAALSAAKQTRLIFAGSVWGCIVALVMSPVCLKTLGAPGGIVTLIITSCIVTVTFVIAYRKNLAPPAEAPTAEVV